MTPDVSPVTGLVYDDRFLDHILASHHPESPERLRAVIRGLRTSGLYDRLLLLEPVPEAEDHIRRIHTTDHIDSVRDIPVTGRVAFLAAAGGCGAVKAVHTGRVRNAFCAVRPPGHHAHNNGGNYDGPGQGQGFCFFNNIAIAARYAQDVCGYRKILIVDWDFHHGNGTEHAFYDDPSVLLLTTQYPYVYPGTADPDRTGRGAGKGYSVTRNLSMGAGDDEVLEVWTRELLPRAEVFKPDFVLVSAGFDARERDSIGCLALTDEGFAALTRLAVDIAERHCGGRLVSFLEGGYDPEGLGKAVTAHVKALIGNRRFPPERPLF